MEARELIAKIISEASLISATISSPLDKQAAKKIQIRPLAIKGQNLYQWSESKGAQIFHHNFSPEKTITLLEEALTKYKQFIIFTQNADYQFLVSKKGAITILKKASTKSSLSMSHNRKKQYLLSENTPIPFLEKLGVMNKEGVVYSQKRDKFRQINRFVEIIDDIIPSLDSSHKIHIVDFGSGKSYLTFALYYYLKEVKKLSISITGIDLKEDVIKSCQQLARDLNYSDLKFICGDINQFASDEKINMVISLHACDTATDAAIEKAVRWGAEVILCVPCCQHELFNQVKNEALQPLLKHGILKERFAALVTDAARAELLETLGYKVQVLEFIDMEHTPKNILIRAVKSAKREKLKSYLAFKKELNINPSLEVRFNDELS